ncbi:hypothetical protein M885DRAFT_585838 [Pelagophyceae sp. CCMP2097]|nr:hypothetical protein M885DRAFT_585838 [Pelagophyceae sp. CCMP2097]|mmetsp:Transcript_20162/g.68291  ORF Transcript_20162/g.68291 Transcript_20162/m.68291 type:complete len:316 (-) Transcript_20162:94-1041(-)|eukprot:CAMPEP_0206817478 /NCGR_PEP_ID=MMETSP0975-20121206/10316_1 /ASSEMBLY_ACC=CAM_ASM_000399 /TAXON_ID=483370 /ORGANISM="non described non described, Strain CCMP2097" /LENGTH=315 /DNA_ID=CAMNT_0054359677 /DNA_START=20 /DNA_END=967 /DNA_ORIENTATION=-
MSTLPFAASGFEVMLGLEAPRRALVFLSTSRQGGATVDALVASKRFTVFGTTRSGKSAALEAKGATAVQFGFRSAVECDAAIAACKPDVVWFTTLISSRAKEAADGRMVVDACQRAGVAFVVYSSVADCDTCPESVGHFKSKLEVEDALRNSGLKHSILRPVAFFENFDDEANYNPLTRGKVKGLWPAETKVKLVACADIGAAGCAMLLDPLKFQGVVLDCVGDECDGRDLAAALTAASGVPSEYSTAVPRFVLYLCLGDLYFMVRFFEETGYSSEISKFRAVVPNCMDARTWFKTKGQWADGTKFSQPGYCTIA